MGGTRTRRGEIVHVAVTYSAETDFSVILRYNWFVGEHRVGQARAWSRSRREWASARRSETAGPEVGRPSVVAGRRGAGHRVVRAGHSQEQRSDAHGGGRRHPRSKESSTWG